MGDLHRERGSPPVSLENRETSSRMEENSFLDLVSLLKLPLESASLVDKQATYGSIGNRCTFASRMAHTMQRESTDVRKCILPNNEDLTDVPLEELMKSASVEYKETS